jgi:hypothetical protein
MLGGVDDDSQEVVVRERWDEDARWRMCGGPSASGMSIQSSEQPIGDLEGRQELEKT